MDVAEDYVLPMMAKPPREHRDSLRLGYVDVYSTFLYFSTDAERKHGLPVRNLLIDLGRFKMTRSRESIMEDTVLTMAKQSGLIDQDA